jgi:hypothetical protein
MCHMLFPSYMHLSNIWTGVHIRQFIMQSPSVPCYLASFRPKHLPQPAVLEHSQPLFRPQCFTPI